METYPNLSQEERNKFISQLLTPEPARLNAARHLQEVDLDYSGSPLSLLPENDFLDGPKPGTRAPDATDLTVGGSTTSLFKLPADEQYRLFFFCGNSNDTSAKEIQWAADSSRRFASWLKPYIVKNETVGGTFEEHTVIIDQKGNMHRKYAASSPCIYLIRPDGYVAYRSPDITSVEKYFEHLGMFRE
jgi:hypothetical protein